MGHFFRSSRTKWARTTNGEIKTHDGDHDDENDASGIGRSHSDATIPIINGGSSSRRNVVDDRRRTSYTSNNSNSSRSVSCSAKTVKIGSSGRTEMTGITATATNSSSTATTGGSSATKSAAYRNRRRFRNMGSVNFQSFRSISSKSLVSDLDVDLESLEMAPIGESSQELGSTEMKKIAGLAEGGPQQHRNQGSGNDEVYISAEFTLASGSNAGSRNTRGRSNNSSNNSSSKDHHGRDYNSKDSTTAADIYESCSITGNTSVMMDRERAVNVGRSGTKFVYVILICTALTLSVVTYLFVRNSEYREFESEFRSYARETADLAETNADHTFYQLNTLSTTVTSEGLLGRTSSYHHEHEGSSTAGSHEEDGEESTIGSWPNVTIPHFDQRIIDLSDSAGAIMLLHVPLVQLKDRDEWERYANIHAPWRTHMAHSSSRRALEDKAGEEITIATTPDPVTPTETPGDVLVLDDDQQQHEQQHEHHHQQQQHEDPNYVPIHACSHLHTNETREGFTNVDAYLDSVLRNEGGFENPQGMAAPIYQYGGPNHERTNNSSIALMDLWSHPIFRKEVIASIEYDVPVISEYLDVSFLDGALSTTDHGVDDHNHHSSSLWNSKYTVYGSDETDHGDHSGHGGMHTEHGHKAREDLTLPSIRSFTLNPVKESFEPDARTIGFIVGVVPWSTYFQNVLKSSAKLRDNNRTNGKAREINGIVVKVVSDCGSMFTFVLNSDNLETKVQVGDWKEQYGKYEDLVYTSRFFFKEHPKGLSRHCHFDLHIFPNDEFRDAYRTRYPWVYALAVVGIFLFTAGIFACYDAFVFKGQRHIVTEATGMIVENARRAAQNERDLNDFIAHEVRNPLAAAISACAFVSSAMIEDSSRRLQAKNNDDSEDDIDDAERQVLIATEEQRKEIQGDINIIDSSLHFINDLLRNMLDMQRAGSNQINIENKPTDIMNDVFKPIEALMHLRDAPFEMILECSGSNQLSIVNDDDDQLVVMTDPMRLKQVLLNLTRNATKFVEKGFIRCTARVNPANGFVELSVDDSGPGIPYEKRGQVFGKFQQSLDSLQQGTGIGLSLCKKMVELMGGSLYIDNDYDSGVPGCPGARFVIQLKIPPLQFDQKMFHDSKSRHERARLRRLQAAMNTISSLPEKQTSDKSLICSPAVAKQTEYAMQPRSASSLFTQSTVSLSESATDRRQDSFATNMDMSLASLEAMEEEKQRSTKMVPLPTALQPSDGEDSFQDTSKDTINTDTDEEEAGSGEGDKQLPLTELPKNLSVLFVDDDMIVRKLFSRTLKKINPTWNCKEASSGETAIEIITTRTEGTKKFLDEPASSSGEEDDGFDLIFMDQYMASVQKQLLGTETVRKIRANGFHKPIICGLSANDVEDAFYNAGSDAFMFKPFPCKKDELEKELLRIINIRCQ
mmetsp:Transcript_22621/g.46129  ORF Transcript_22621/g.46129 Transcript_22621/m.46129 type:complete len:1415 (-) Transcript_22621:656-4900(-)|eukprot:CAMPEP_0201150796 /NCGR_PEP_ID=MMETSP0851-20130426/11848_1 /ASSEMBLY_ACC=CAM_ASM_000631 /TAXON_ID=183588 /ORGANISM="Pseudo-nitzschia fraudulenta, Strain WWA7" /LENGTH=1414 /DNA_ID=CAMNT_0047427519 /DNA_START=337 /DNA_END=4581 /DNA_ORIENTATION=+